VIIIKWDFNTNIAEQNTTLYGIWKIKTYTVTFASQGGSSVANQSIDYNNKLNIPTIPTNSGYTFVGWYTDINYTTLFDFNNTTIKSDITLYAKWSIVTYNITFASQGGSSVSPQIIAQGGYVTQPTSPNYTGYSFGGWYTDINYTTLFNFTNTISSDLTLYAKWNMISYNITFDSQSGSSVAPQTINYGSYSTQPTAPNRDGYTFAGWYTSNSYTALFDFNNTVITSSKTLYAKWTIISYNITFDSQGGTNISSQTINYGSYATQPTVPTKTNYTFGGWYTDSGCTNKFNFTTMPIISNITLYAKWNVLSYTVTFNSNSGTTVSSQTINYNSYATQPTSPTRTGYSFIGWYTDSGCTNIFNFTTTYIINNITLYAKWVMVSYTVIFDSKGGSTITSQNIPSGSYATQPTTKPTKTGYTFIDWCYDSNAYYTFYFNQVPITQNRTLYARWSIISYTVSFNSNGGTTISPETINYGSYAYAPTEPSKTGYDFKGWYSDSGLTIPFNFTTTTITGNITLYAKFVLSGSVSNSITQLSSVPTEVSSISDPLYNINTIFNNGYFYMFVMVSKDLKIYKYINNAWSLVSTISKNTECNRVCLCSVGTDIYCTLHIYQDGSYFKETYMYKFNTTNNTMNLLNYGNNLDIYSLMSTPNLIYSNGNIYLLNTFDSNLWLCYNWKYNISSNTWSKIADRVDSTEESNNSTAILYNNKIYLFIGDYPGSNHYVVIHIYDIATDTWSGGTSNILKLLNGSYSNSVFRSSFLYNNKIYLITREGIYIYDPNTETLNTTIISTFNLNYTTYRQPMASFDSTNNKLYMVYELNGVVTTQLVTLTF